jgi:hypothetical protein
LPSKCGWLGITFGGFPQNGQPNGSDVRESHVVVIEVLIKTAVIVPSGAASATFQVILDSDIRLTANEVPLVFVFCALGFLGQREIARIFGTKLRG